MDAPQHPPIEWVSFALGPVAVSIAWLITTYARGLGDVAPGTGGNVLLAGALGLVLSLAFIQALLRPGPFESVPVEGFVLVWLVAQLGVVKVLVSPTSDLEMRFLLEGILITALPLFVAALSVRPGVPMVVAWALALGGAAVGLMVLYFVVAFGPIVRRLDIEAALGIGLAKNQLGHGFALSAASAVFLAFRSSSRWASVTWWSVAALCTGGIVGTGSRSAVLGGMVAVGILLLFAFRGQRLHNRVLLPFGLLALVGAVLWLAAGAADERLFRRFTPELVGGVLGLRLEMLSSAIDTIVVNARWWEALAGMSAQYYLPFQGAIGVGQGAIDPHNLFVSALFFWGPAVALVVVGVVVAGMWRATEVAFRGATLDEAFLLALLIPALVYSLSSGRLTRAFSIWVILGLIWGQHYLTRLTPDEGS